MADEFEGFANDPTTSKGKRIDPRDVPAYVDETDAGKVRDESQTTKSSIVQFKTEGKGTNGAPAAVVPAPADPADETPADSDDASDDAPDADAAGGKEAKES